MKKTIIAFIHRYNAGRTPLREKIVSSLTSLVAILALVTVVHVLSGEFTFSLLVLASMGSSAILLFAIPHSPLSQPWPLVGGHLISAAVGVACAHWIPYPTFATAAAVASAVFAMHWLRCLHPPSAATAMVAVLGGPEIHAIGWKFCYEVVAVNAVTMLVLALAVNNLVPGRRYPLRHRHHAHHAQFQQTAPSQLKLTEKDFAWALGKMDALIDITEEDLVDIYEFAVEHAQARRKTESVSLPIEYAVQRSAHR